MVWTMFLSIRIASDALYPIILKVPEPRIIVLLTLVAHTVSQLQLPCKYSELLIGLDHEVFFMKV